jgi:hypothetical protein
VQDILLVGTSQGDFHFDPVALGPEDVFSASLEFDASGIGDAIGLLQYGAEGPVYLDLSRFGAASVQVQYRLGDQPVGPVIGHSMSQATGYYYGGDVRQAPTSVHYVTVTINGVDTIIVEYDYDNQGQGGGETTAVDMNGASFECTHVRFVIVPYGGTTAPPELLRLRSPQALVRHQ